MHTKSTINMPHIHMHATHSAMHTNSSIQHNTAATGRSCCRMDQRPRRGVLPLRPRGRAPPARRPRAPRPLPLPRVDPNYRPAAPLPLHLTRGPPRHPAPAHHAPQTAPTQPAHPRPPQAPTTTPTLRRLTVSHCHMFFTPPRTRPRVCMWHSWLFTPYLTRDIYYDHSVHYEWVPSTSSYRCIRTLWRQWVRPDHTEPTWPPDIPVPTPPNQLRLQARTAESPAAAPPTRLRERSRSRDRPPAPARNQPDTGPSPNSPPHTRPSPQAGGSNYEARAQDSTESYYTDSSPHENPDETGINTRDI